MSIHDSDCAKHNEPAMPAGECDCSVADSIKEDPILQFFAYEHLPAHLQALSKPFHDLAHSLVESVPRNPERTVALRTSRPWASTVALHSRSPRVSRSRAWCTSRPRARSRRTAGA